MSDMTSSVDGIVESVKMIMDRMNQSDYALLDAIEALAKKVIELQVRIELLEDLKGHKHEV